MRVGEDVGEDAAAEDEKEEEDDDDDDEAEEEERASGAARVRGVASVDKSGSTDAFL